MLQLKKNNKALFYSYGLWYNFHSESMNIFSQKDVKDVIVTNTQKIAL